MPVIPGVVCMEFNSISTGLSLPAISAICFPLSFIYLLNFLFYM